MIAQHQTVNGLANRNIDFLSGNENRFFGCLYIPGIVPRPLHNAQGAANLFPKHKGQVCCIRNYLFNF